MTLKLLINYANETFRKSQRFNSRQGIRVGLLDKVISYGPEDVDPIFFDKNREILCQKKGNGYWLWKPYFIQKSLELIEQGDFLFYCDSGSYFINPIQPLIDIVEQCNQDVIPFELGYVEKFWTKRDAFVLMNCDTPRYTDSKQRLAAFIFMRKSRCSTDFAGEWLHLAEDGRLITDLDNQLGQPNYPEFKEHRHDQSIYSLLTKKYGFEAYRDPSQWGIPFQDLFPNSNYTQLINHTREGRHPIPLPTRIAWKTRMLALECKRVLPFRT